MNLAPGHDALVTHQDWLAVMGHGHIEVRLGVGTLAEELAELWTAERIQAWTVERTVPARGPPA